MPKILENTLGQDIYRSERVKQYYLPYDQSIDVNYIYVLIFYSIAKYNKQTKRFDTINYSTQKELLDLINERIAVYGLSISASTLSRILKDSKYKSFFSVDTKEKKITLNNDIQNKAFVKLSQKEVDLILETDEELFSKYLMYLKYYASISSSKKTDPTAKQFLAATGYSVKSSYDSKLSEYNRKLTDREIVKIDKSRDNNGHERNSYTFI